MFHVLGFANHVYESFDTYLWICVYVYICSIVRWRIHTSYMVCRWLVHTSVSHVTSSSRREMTRTHHICLYMFNREMTRTHHICSLIHTCDMTHWDTCDMSIKATSVRKLNELRGSGDFNHEYTWFDLLICVTWLTDTCDLTHRYVFIKKKSNV